MTLSFDRALKVRRLLLAGVFAVTRPMGPGYVIFRANPSACYDGPCALPLLLLTVAPFAAPVLPVPFAIDRRREWPFADGWLPTILFSGVAGQTAISLFGVAAASPNIRRLFFRDILFIPQGLVTGLAMGVVFRVALHVLGQKGPDIQARPRQCRTYPRLGPCRRHGQRGDRRFRAGLRARRGPEATILAPGRRLGASRAWGMSRRGGGVGAGRLSPRPRVRPTSHGFASRATARPCARTRTSPRPRHKASRVPPRRWPPAARRPRRARRPA